MSNPWDRPPRLRPAHDVQGKTGLGRFVATLNPEAAIGDRLALAGRVSSQARREADFQVAELVGQRQLLGKARNSHCRPIPDGHEWLLRRSPVALALPRGLNGPRTNRSPEVAPSQGNSMPSASTIFMSTPKSIVDRAGADIRPG